MTFIRNLPGPLLIFLGALSLSFGGLIVKSFEGATLWQILFWRSLFFSLTVLAFLILSYRGKTIESFYKSGLPGFFGGIILSFGFCGYVFAMYNTTVANTNFIISLQILFLAIFGYFFLKEKINLITLFSICLAMTGVLLMVGNSLSPGELSGNLAAFTMPITFAVLIMIVRKFPSVDMVPAQFVAGVSSCLIGFLLSTKIMISPHDIFLGVLAGFFQVGFGFIFITIGARTTPSAMVGIIMLSESVLGPIWAFLFVSERPSVFGLIGGPPGVLVGGILGGIGGDLLGGAFYDLIFRDNVAGRITENLSQSFVKKGVKTGVGAGLLGGGFAPYGGRVHAGEFVFNEKTTDDLEKKYPGLLTALNNSRGSQVDQVLETYMSYGNESEGSERLIPLPFEKVVTRTVLVENDGEDTSSSPFMDLYRRG